MPHPLPEFGKWITSRAESLAEEGATEAAEELRSLRREFQAAFDQWTSPCRRKQCPRVEK